MCQEIEINIERLGTNGEGVGHLDGLTVFVDGALIEEMVRATIHEKHKTFARAQVDEIIIRSPDRVEPICPIFGKCGGCQIMHLAYPKQLEMKTQRVKDAMERIGKIFDVEVELCIASPLSLAYRNKIQLPSCNECLGLYSQDTHDVVDVEKCFIHCELGEKVFQEIRKTLPLPEVIKHVLIRTAVKGLAALVIFVTEIKDVDLTSLAQQLMSAVPEIKGVLQNVNPSRRNTILGKQFFTIAGKDWIQEKICDLFFKVSPASFFQVNPLQAEAVYNKVVELCDLKGEETVLDAYCGVGTLSLILAKKAKKVIGVECVSDAIADAKGNASFNRIKNAKFYCSNAEDFTTEDNIDVAVVNPPRKGCERPFIEKLLSLEPRTIVYISCDPATLARDLNLLQPKYAIEIIQPFDMFPQTAHVETVVKLFKKPVD